MLVQVATSPAGKWLPADRDLKKKKCVTLLYGSDQRIGAGGEGRCRRKERRRGARHRAREVRGTAPNVMIFQMFTLAQMFHYLSTPLRGYNVTIVTFPIFNYKSCQHAPASVRSRQPHCKNKATGRHICHTEH
jgi:hypothetical protein